MLILNNPADAAAVTNEGLSSLLQQRFDQLSQGKSFDTDEMGYFIIVDPTDTIDALETATGCPITGSWLNDSHYGDEDFTPPWEILEEHHSCYEMVFILNDDSYAITLLIPKLLGIDNGLLAMCQEYGDAENLQEA